MRSISVIGILLASAVPAVAAVPATPEGAARIETAFRKVLGPLPGVVTVTPEGATYRAEVDFAPLIALIPEPELKLSVTPYVLTLTDNGDGTWGMAEDQSFAANLSMPGAFEVAYRIDSLRSEGVFDESLVAATSYHAEAAGMTIESNFIGPDGRTVSGDSTTVERVTVDMTGKAGAAGGVDATEIVEYTGYRQTIALPMGGPDMPTAPVVVSIDSYRMDADIAGFRSAEILDLIGFFVARPEAARIVADQEVLRSALTAAMPLFGRIEAGILASPITADTPVGRITAEELGFSVGLNGITAEGRVFEGVSVRGLSIPAGLMPDWAHALLPADATLGVEVTGYDLAAPAAMLIGGFDFTRPEPIDPAMQFGLLGALLPRGEVEIALTPSSLGSDLYGIEATGLFTAGMMVPPSGSVQLSATGLDALETRLDAASDDPDAAGLRGVLGLARSLAQPGTGGALAWEIEFTPDQRVLVNGTDVTGMQ